MDKKNQIRLVEEWIKNYQDDILDNFEAIKHCNEVIKELRRKK